MSRRALCLLLVAVLSILLVGALPSHAQERITITWFIGLGTGLQPQQIEVENKVVENFNASQDVIDLQTEGLLTSMTAPDYLNRLIASNETPDLIVGPASMTSFNYFYGQWLDLQPLVDSTGYDLTQFPQVLIDYYRTSEGLVSLPFAAYPSFIYYRPALFDAAGLEYPPDAYGEPYILDGQAVEWNMDTLGTVAMRLTVDTEGHNATQPEFDPEHIFAWGFAFQWAEPHEIPTLWGIGSLWDAQTGDAVIPASWRAGWNWYYNAMWVDHFYPNAAQPAGDQFATEGPLADPFGSGIVAMAVSHSWYTCCVDDTHWQVAANPSYKGVVTARLHTDSFRILNTAQHPKEAFAALTYLVGRSPDDLGVSSELLEIYGGMPARDSQRQTWFDTQNVKYTQGVNWDVVKDSLGYADNPSYEAYIPNYDRVMGLLYDFRDRLDSTPGLNVDDELDALQADLQAAFDEAAAP